MEMAGGVAAATADSPGGASAAARPSRYESQKRRDWQTFGQYLRNHRPPLELARCSGAHVLEFLRYLDQFGKTKVHAPGCPFFGHPSPPAPCPCPLRQAWGSLDALVGRLRAAFEEHGGRPEANPFGARAVRLYLRDVRDSQAKARGIAYEKKRRRRHPPAAHRQQQAAKQRRLPAAPAPPPPPPGGGDGDREARRAGGRGGPAGAALLDPARALPPRPLSGAGHRAGRPRRGRRGRRRRWRHWGGLGDGNGGRRRGARGRSGRVPDAALRFPLAKQANS